MGLENHTAISLGLLKNIVIFLNLTQTNKLRKQSQLQSNTLQSRSFANAKSKKSEMLLLFSLLPVLLRRDHSDEIFVWQNFCMWTLLEPNKLPWGS